MPAPLVSILTTSYNRAGFLGSTIESVLAQTYADFEYIIVDDCSPDDSLSVAQKYESDPRLKVISNPVNLGDYGNRNKAISLARGKYIKFVDCDDILYPHCLRSMVEVAEAFPDAGVVFAYRERPPWRYPIQLSPEQVYRMHFTEGGVLHQGAMSSLLRREAILSVGGFPEIYTGDVACWLKLARTFSVVLVAEGLFWWRQHAGQLSESLRTVSPKWAANQAEGARLHWEALNHPGCPLPEAERAVYRSRIERDYLWMILRNALRGRVQVVAELMRGFPFQLTAGFASCLRAGTVSTSATMATPIVLPVARALRAETIPCILVGETPPRVSVLLPVADVENCVAATIDSILAQEFDNWELIVIDDASSDGTAQVLQLYAGHPRIRLCRNPSRLGKWTNHNQCASLARGRYLKFVHAGDALEKRALKVFVWYATRFPDAGIIVSETSERYLMPLVLSPEDCYFAESGGGVSVMKSPTRVLYPRDSWDRHAGMDANCAAAPAKLHLDIVRSHPAVFIQGGLVSHARESKSWSLAAGRDELRQALSAANCPLSLPDRMMAIKRLDVENRRDQLARCIGNRSIAKRIIKALLPRLPQSRFVARLNTANPKFDATLYPYG